MKLVETESSKMGITMPITFFQIKVWEECYIKMEWQEYREMDSASTDKYTRHYILRKEDMFLVKRYVTKEIKETQRQIKKTFFVPNELIEHLKRYKALRDAIKNWDCQIIIDQILPNCEIKVMRDQDHYNQALRLGMVNMETGAHFVPIWKY